MMSEPHTLTRAEVDAFLGDWVGADGEGLRVALASLRKDGRPFVVPLGFWYDGEYLYVTMSPTRGGTARIRRDPRVCATVYIQHSPAKFVTIWGDAVEIPDPDNEISIRIYSRYHGRDGYDYGDEFLRRWLEPGKVVFRLGMDNWTGFDLSKVNDFASVAQTAADKAYLAARREPQA